MYKFDSKELTKEKSLWDVFKLSLNIQPNNIQLIILITTALLLYLNAFFLENNDSILLKDTRQWASMGFNFSITTLGFLITGFTIFATLAKPQMLLQMMDHYNEKYKMPTLKYNLIVFMKVFIGYIFLSIIYVLIILLGQVGGFISNLFLYFTAITSYKVCIIKMSYVFVGTSFMYLLLLLKSFVFNIYATIMTFLRWEYINEDQKYNKHEETNNLP